MPSMKTPSQKSMNVAIQEQKEMAAMPDDIGFLPGEDLQHQFPINSPPTRIYIRAHSDKTRTATH